MDARNIVGTVYLGFGLGVGVSGSRTSKLTLFCTGLVSRFGDFDMGEICFPRKSCGGPSKLAKPDQEGWGALGM